MWPHQKAASQKNSTVLRVLKSAVERSILDGMDDPKISRRRKVITLWILVFIIGIFLGMVVKAFLRGWDKMVIMDCEHQLSEIGVECRIYARDHGGRFPSQWTDLTCVEGAENWRRMFRCPYSGHDAGGWTNVDLWADYHLLPGRTMNDPPNRILAVENLANHKGTGANVLYVDGSSGWLATSKLLKTELK